MSEDIPRLRLQQTWRECRQHAHYMDYALTDTLQAMLVRIGQRLKLEANAP